MKMRFRLVYLDNKPRYEFGIAKQNSIIAGMHSLGYIMIRNYESGVPKSVVRTTLLSI